MYLPDFCAWRDEGGVVACTVGWCVVDEYLYVRLHVAHPMGTCKVCVTHCVQTCSCVCVHFYVGDVHVIVWVCGHFPVLVRVGVNSVRYARG